MSTAPATPGAAAADPAAAPPATPAKITSVPADVRRRILSGGKLPPPPTEEEKAKLEKDTADKKAAEEKAAADKKAAEEKSAQEAAEKKKKKAPKLPDPPAEAPPLPTDLKTAVREVLKENEPTPPARKYAPEVEAEIRLAQHAETVDPAKYTGMAKKVEEFYVAHDELLTVKAKELGGRTSSEYKDYLESDEYRQYVAQTRPHFERGDKEKLKESLISTRAKDEARRELEPKLQELERKQLEAQVKPEIDQSVQRTLRVILTDPRDEKEQDPALVEFVKDPMKFGEAHPEEARIIASEAGEFRDYVETVYRVDKKLEVPDAKNNPKHKFIHEFMVRQNDAMAAANPNGVPMPDGKILIDPKTYVRLKLDQDPEQRYRTWNAEEIAGMLAAEGNSRVLTKLQQRREGVTKSIYAKQAAPALPASSGQEEPTPTKPEAIPASPEAPTSRAPGNKKAPPEKNSRAAKYA